MGIKTNGNRWSVSFAEARPAGDVCESEPSVPSTSRKPREAPKDGLWSERHQRGVITWCARAVRRCPAAAQPRRVRPRNSHLTVAPLSCPLAPHSHAWRGSGACSAGPCPRMGTNPPIDARRSIATRTYTRTAHTIAASRTSPLAMLSLAESFPERVPQVLPWTYSTKKRYAHSGFAAPPLLLLALGRLGARSARWCP